MVYRGKVQNGHVIFDEASRLPEGTVVDVEPVEQHVGPTGNVCEFLATNAHWHGSDEEVYRLLAELKQSKRDELERETDGSEPQL